MDDKIKVMNFLEQQKVRFQVASEEVAAMKRNLAELESTSSSVTPSDAVNQVRNEVTSLRAKVCISHELWQ